jgi:hypothetical protein
MAEGKNFSGSCHCGKVRFEVTTDLAKVMQCNCSICSRVGALRTFVPAEQFNLLSGEEALTDYQFGKHHIHHLFCSTCGISSFVRGTSSDGKAMVAVNARCLDCVDPAALTITHFDGKSR